MQNTDNPASEHLSTKVSLMGQQLPGQVAQSPPIPTRHRAAPIISVFSSLLQTQLPVVRTCEPQHQHCSAGSLQGAGLTFPTPSPTLISASLRLGLSHPHCCLAFCSHLNHSVLLGKKILQESWKLCWTLLTDYEEI